MKSKPTIVFVLVALPLTFGFSLRSRAGGNHSDRDDRGRASDEHDDGSSAPLKLLGVIAIPGSPIASSDIVFVDQTTKMLYFADRSNSSVDVLNGESDLYLGRIQSDLTGSLHFTGPTSAISTPPVTSTHQGPNGVVATADKKIWAGDGDTTVKVMDGDPTSPTYLQIIASISTAGLTTISNCGGGVTGTCNRDDEIAYDPVDNIIMVNTDEPNTLLQPFSTFIDASFPYTIRGQINFAAQGTVASGGLELPIWDPGIHRFLQTLPVTDSTSMTGSIAIVNPVAQTVDRVISLKGFDCSPSGEALGADQHLVVACKIPGASTTEPSSFPLILDVSTGGEIGPGINQVGGGDEVNYNPGDDRFFVSSTVDGASANPGVLGVINAANGNWLQNLPAAMPTIPPSASGKGGLKASGTSGNLATLEENNHVFVIIKATAGVTDSCGTFAVIGAGGTVNQTDYGCVAVFGPRDEGR